jgi:hypothetical protein
MTENIEIFENEEATKFLDYFVTYMKLMDKVDNIKNLASQQPNEMILVEPETIALEESQFAIPPPITLEK